MTAAEHDHSPEAIRERLEQGPRASYVRDWIYGGIDGAVTTFAVVSGVVGAQLSSSIIVILGLANLIADGFSMAASNYTGTKHEREEIDRIRDMEYRHIELYPEGEREEVRQIFAKKGFSGDELERVVDVVTAETERWVEVMMADEFGLPQDTRSPGHAALMTFSAFVVCGFVPLMPYVFGFSNAFVLSIAMTGAVFVVIGSARSRWSMLPWWRAGLETLFIGGTAAALSYVVGMFLRRLAL